MTTIQRLFLFYSIFLFGTIAAATDFQPDKKITLSELVNIALENNPTTRQAWWNARRAAAALGSAKSTYYPQIDLDANVSNGRTFKFINGPDTNYTIVGADIILTMLLYDFGERNASVDMAKNALLAANWQTDWTLQKVMIRVLENAYALAHAQEVYGAALVSKEDAEKVLITARELNRTGLTPISDVYTTQATFSQMKMEATQQKALVDIQKAKLMASIGLSAETQLELASFDPMPAPKQPQITELINLAYKQRADLLVKQARVAESLSKLNKAKAGYYPKVSFSGAGGANHAFHDRADAMQYQVMLNVDIPLFHGFETMYQNQIAYAETQLSIEDMNDLQLNISLNVLTYSKSLEAAQEMLPDADDNLQNAMKAYDSVLERYKVGKEGIDEVSNALRHLATARVRYSDVKTRWLVSLANLAYAPGTLVGHPYTEKSCE